MIFAADNGLNPVWPQKQFLFDVHNPTFSFLRFTVYEEDMFSDPNFLAQATCPIRLLRTGDDSVSSAVLRLPGVRRFHCRDVLMCVIRLQERPSEKQLQ